MAPKLVLQAVCAGYGATQVLLDVSLEVEDGEIVTVLGPNGAGKSTLLNTISGVVRLKTGSITFEGKRISGGHPHKIVAGGIVQVPEGRRIFAGLSVEENLTVGGYTATSKQSRKAAKEQVFSLFPVLEERRNQAAGTLSGGEQQMLAIGRALYARPRLLMLDEPSMGLAPQLISRIYESFASIAATGTAILLIEQNAKKALEVSTRAYVLDQGQVVISRPSEELRGSTELQQLYIGGHVQT
jgi:branched-chain amino acid transport system ATP-binding protein